jgi:hypothetical protein
MVEARLRTLPWILLMGIAGQLPAQEVQQWPMAGPLASLPAIADAPLSDVTLPRVNLPWPAMQGAAPASLETDIYRQAPPLDQQLAALGKRIDALEHPIIKYPANIQFSGVFQADGVTFNQDDANKLPMAAGGMGQEIQNGADFRRARLGVRAALANNMNAFMQMDFAGPGRPTFTDLWVDWH